MTRPPKPLHLHMVEGTLNVTRHRKRVEREPRPVGDITDPPDWLTASQKATWRYAVRHAPPGLLKKCPAPWMTR